MENVTLPRRLLKQILHQSQSSPEVEICGLIAAKQGQPRRCVEVANIAECPEHFFTMDPAQQINAFRSMRERDEELFAIYHSHPYGPAQPSDNDLQQAAYPEALYVIVSLETPGNPDVRGYRIRDGELHQVKLKIQKSAI